MASYNTACKTGSESFRLRPVAAEAAQALSPRQGRISDRSRGYQNLIRGAAAAATEHKTAGANPNRALFKRSTYAGVADTGPVAGETFEQKVARLKAVSAGAKQRSDEGGDPGPIHASSAAATEAPAPSASAAATEPVAQSAEITAPPPAATSSSPAHKPTGNADRSLMKRSTYVGVTDTGPVAGETFEQKVARLAKVAAAAKQRAEGG